MKLLVMVFVMIVCMVQQVTFVKGVIRDITQIQMQPLEMSMHVLVSG